MLCLFSYDLRRRAAVFESPLVPFIAIKPAVAGRLFIFAMGLRLGKCQALLQCAVWTVETKANYLVSFLHSVFLCVCVCVAYLGTLPRGFFKLEF